MNPDKKLMEDMKKIVISFACNPTFREKRTSDFYFYLKNSAALTGGSVLAVVNHSYMFLEEILEKHGRKPEALIPILQGVQEQYNYLPEDLLLYLAGAIGVSAANVYGVATFYENFSMEPKGKYLIKVCDGTACHVKRSTEILDALQAELGISKEKRTTDDMLFTVETVACVGACGLAPVITINGKVYSKVTPESVVNVIKSLYTEEESG